jgi:RND family efflux transporter MFP subunit
MKPSSIAKVILPIILLAAGVGMARGLMATKKKAEKAPPQAHIPAVEYVTVQAGSPIARVQGTGIVEGDRQVALSALVSGEVVWVADNLDPGGRFRNGAQLLRVDPRDYEVAVSQEAGRVRQAEVELELEMQRQNTAQREWELLGGGKDPGAAPLALRKPQLTVAEQNVESARQGLKRAELNLERTKLVAPFNAMVLSENVEKGQLLAPGGSVVTLVGTDRFRVKVSVPVYKLASIAIPGVNGETGSPAKVVQELSGGSSIERGGRVIGLAGQLDPQTRTAHLYVGINKPLEGDGLPMLPGAFVRVSVEGLAIDGAIAVPREAISGGDTAWTITSEDTLARRTLQIAWRDARAVFVTAGLTSGERVVTTPPSLPVEGAKVKPFARGKATQTNDGKAAGQDAEPAASEG